MDLTLGSSSRKSSTLDILTREVGAVEGTLDEMPKIPSTKSETRNNDRNSNDRNKSVVLFRFVLRFPFWSIEHLSASQKVHESSCRT
jgi:hypothetical protein